MRRLRAHGAWCLLLLEGRGLAGGGKDVFLREAEGLTQVRELADLAEAVRNAQGEGGNAQSPACPL